jgi:hypothetical protein
MSLYTETCKQNIALGRKNYFYPTLVMAITDFRIKYDNFVLGHLWSLLKPLLMFGTLYFVFSVGVRWDVENYNLYLLLGIILWNFLAEVTLNSMVLLEGKVYCFRRIWTFPEFKLVCKSKKGNDHGEPTQKVLRREKSQASPPALN